LIITIRARISSVHVIIGNLKTYILAYSRKDTKDEVVLVLVVVFKSHSWKERNVIRMLRKDHLRYAVTNWSLEVKNGGM